jgi:hypothetical protein
LPFEVWRPEPVSIASRPKTARRAVAAQMSMLREQPPIHTSAAGRQPPANGSASASGQETADGVHGSKELARVVRRGVPRPSGRKRAERVFLRESNTPIAIKPRCGEGGASSAMDVPG